MGISDERRDSPKLLQADPRRRRYARLRSLSTHLSGDDRLTDIGRVADDFQEGVSLLVRGDFNRDVFGEGRDVGRRGTLVGPGHAGRAVARFGDIYGDGTTGERLLEGCVSQWPGHVPGDVAPAGLWCDSGWAGCGEVRGMTSRMHRWIRA